MNRLHSEAMDSLIDTARQKAEQLFQEVISNVGKTSGSPAPEGQEQYVEQSGIEDYVSGLNKVYQCMNLLDNIQTLTMTNRNTNNE